MQSFLSCRAMPTTWNCSARSSAPRTAPSSSNSGLACARLESGDHLDRWLVEGYWYLSDFVPAHTSHPNFPRPESAEYYQAATQRLWDLQNWFVTGRFPYLDSYQWPDL